MKRRIRPALVLLFLSPAIGELLSSSSPPAEFFFPPLLAMQVALYGCGALLIREVTLRWGKGWPTIFVLGAAYAIAEEGLLCKSFFDPNWMDLGDFAHYGRWAGVNWIWSLNLIIYHAFVSIAIPILLTEAMFPDRRNEPWANRRGLITAAAFLTADVLIGYFALKPPNYPVIFKPPTLYGLIALGIVVGLCVLARRMPRTLAGLPLEKTSAPHPGWLGFLGFLFVPMTFIITAILRKVGAPFGITMLAISAVTILCILMISKWTTTNTAWPQKHKPVLMTLALGVLIFTALILSVLSLKWLKAVGLLVIPLIITGVVLIVRRLSPWLKISVPWSDRHALALATGALAVFVMHSFIAEAQNASRPDNTTGMSLVGMAAIAFLAWLWREVSATESKPDGDLKCSPITP